MDGATLGSAGPHSIFLLEKNIHPRDISKGVSLIYFFVTFALFSVITNVKRAFFIIKFLNNRLKKLDGRLINDNMVIFYL